MMFETSTTRSFLWLPIAIAGLWAWSASAQFQPSAECVTDPGFEFCHFTEYVPTAGADADGIVEEGELMRVFHFIDVIRTTSEPWTNVELAVCYGQEIGAVNPIDSIDGKTKVIESGKRLCIRRTYDVVEPGFGISIDNFADTGVDEKGRQEYVSCGRYELNRGPRLKYTDAHRRSVQLGGTDVIVLTENGAGDCDGDGVSDQQELDLGTDPFDSADVPDFQP